jgi:hypothetical protein
MSELNIYQRINAVMKAVRYVQKDASISGGGPSYKAVTHDQVVSVARAALVEHGIMIFPEQLEGKIEIMRNVEAGVKMHLYSGMYQINFVNIDNGEDRIVVKLEAHAADNGDKAPGKCITYATKAAILKVLFLETGENDESREEVREKSKTITPMEFAELSEYCYTQGDDGALAWTKIGGQLASAYNIGSLDQLPTSKFKEAIKRCEKAAK